MNVFDHAKIIFCNILAVILAVFAATVEALLPGRSDWLERLKNLSHRFDSYSRQSEPAEAEKPALATGIAGQEAEQLPATDMDPDRLLLAYNQLWQFVHALRSDGLALDEKFCDQAKQEWTVPSLMSYLQNVDRSLQDRAGHSLESASTYFAAAAAARRENRS